jgi:hypothetical protein
VAFGITEAARGCPPEAGPRLIEIATSPEGEYAEFRTHAVRALAGVGSEAALETLLGIAAPQGHGRTAKLPAESPELLAALEGLASGWPDDPRSREILDRARASSRPAIREAVS